MASRLASLFLKHHPFLAVLDQVQHTYHQQAMLIADASPDHLNLIHGFVLAQCKMKEQDLTVVVVWVIPHDGATPDGGCCTLWLGAILLMGNIAWVIRILGNTARVIRMMGNTARVIRMMGYTVWVIPHDGGTPDGGCCTLWLGAILLMTRFS